MFTGIIKAVAKIKGAKHKNRSLFLTIEKPKGWQIKAGDSISTDGACLTVKKNTGNQYLAELMPETLAKTTFGKVMPKKVNLERSMSLKDLLDGHLVMGHIDTVGKIVSVKKVGTSKVYKIEFPRKFSMLVVSKGAIAVDGISLTVVEASPLLLRKGEGWFTVSLVQYTTKNTTLGDKKISDIVNLEFDILAKYLHGSRVSKRKI